jgi:hypothetical protein
MSRAVVEGCLSIDVRQWHREGWFENGLFTTRVAVNEDFGVLITAEVGRTGARVGLWRSICEDQVKVLADQNVSLAWTRCTLGGRRPWFRCRCNRRVALLYYSGGSISCRHCHGLAYQCQSETPRLRSIRSARKIRMRLGAGFSFAEPFPEKPRGMHGSTYLRMRAAAGEAERSSVDMTRKLLRALWDNKNR